MTLRVAILTSFPVDPAAPHGGVEAVARTLVAALSRRGDLDVHVVTTREDVRRPYSASLGPAATVHYLPQAGRLELATLFLAERLQLRKVLSTIRPDVAHAHDVRYAFALGQLGYPYVQTVHGVASVEERVLRGSGPRPWLRRQLLSFLEAVSFRRAALVVANSSYVAGRVPAAVASRVVMIPNPVDPLFFAPHAGAPAEARILWVGRVSRLKAVHVLVSALKLVQRDVPAAHLRLVGPSDDRDYFAELQGIAASGGGESAVDLVGPRHGVELWDEYARACVVALPSVQENVPMSIAEAMAVGRTVVASDVGGVADLVADERTGLLCRPGDVGGLAHALTRVVRDVGLRQRMESEARAIARRRFDPDRVAAQHAEMYEQLTSRGSAASAPLPVLG